MKNTTLRPFKNAAARQSPDFGLRIVQNKATPDEATVYFYDEIGYWGILATEFVPKLAAIDAKTIHLRINSPGGDVFDALAIANAVRAHPSHIITHVDGLAASAASYVATAGHEVRMADNAFLMIHNPWTIAMGNASDFRETADLLDTIGSTILGEYMKRTSAPRADVQAWMDEETWLTAAEAEQHGFIDAIDGAAESAKNSYNLGVFAKVPVALQQTDAKRLDKAQPLRDAGVVLSEREQEAILRDAGFSRSDAKTAIAALAKPVLNQREAGESSDDVSDAINRLLATLHSQPQPAYENGTRAH